jgi:hypothetical protein
MKPQSFTVFDVELRRNEGFTVFSRKRLVMEITEELDSVLYHSRILVLSFYDEPV